MTNAGRKIVVRAKQYMGLVGLDVVRAVHFAKDLYATDEAWAVAAYGFTAQAVCAAKSTGVRLVTGADILRLIEASAGGAPDPQQQMLPEMHDGRPTQADKLLYTISGDNHDKLAQYHGRERDIVIPPDLGIRMIGAYAFGNPWRHDHLAEGITQPLCDWKNIRSVVIPEGVRWISLGAFRGCTSLQSVTLPSTLRHIGPGAFEGCTALQSVSPPPSLEEIWSDAFKDCTSLRDIGLPDSLQKIGISAFKDCTSLRTVELPDSLREIDNSAFANCTSLTGIRIPQSLETIGAWAFEGCTGLDELVLQRDQGKLQIGAYAFKDSGITSLTIEGNIFLEEGCFQGCAQLESVEIVDACGDEAQPASQDDGTPGCLCSEVLPASTFEQCTSLGNVDLPSTLASIGTKAFAGCERLFSVGFPAESGRLAPTPSTDAHFCGPSTSRRASRPSRPRRSPTAGCCPGSRFPTDSGQSRVRPSRSAGCWRGLLCLRPWRGLRRTPLRIASDCLKLPSWGRDAVARSTGARLRDAPLWTSLRRSMTFPAPRP